MFEMIDEQTGKVKFVGTEKDCMAFSMENPNCSYIINDLEKNKRGRNNENIQPDGTDN